MTAETLHGSASRGTAVLPAHDTALRAGALRSHGASGSTVDELLAYGTSAFEIDALLTPPPTPLADELFVEAWSEYVDDAGRDGVLPSLRRRLVQLNFPIEAGISQQPEYQAATRRGQVDPRSSGALALERPEGLQLFLHPTPAGRIPAIEIAERRDFVSLVRAFTHRGEPAPVPDSQGAVIVGGYNNWDRVRRLRAAWLATSPADPSDAEWSRVFAGLMPTKELYQDRFILLSSGPYSATSASAVGMSESDWRAASATIRLEHECTHYFTRRLFGAMRNSLLDELCADYAGIVAAGGRFRPEWFLRFMGLENASGYRVGGRLANYRGTPALSSAAFEILQRVVRSATVQLGRFDDARRRSGSLSPADVVIALARVGLEALATDQGSALLDVEVHRLEAHAATTRRCSVLAEPPTN